MTPNNISNNMPLGAIWLNAGEELYVDPGKMQATRNISMITEFMSGIFESVKRFILGGPSLFSNRFQAKENGGWILLEEDMPGQIQMLELSRQKFKVRRDRWLASSPNIELKTVYEGVSGYFRGTGIAMLETATKTHEKGKLFFRCDRGTVKKIEIRKGEVPVTIDNDSILGYTDGLTPTVRIAGGGVKALVFGGEGIVYDFEGEGTVYLASTPQDQKNTSTTYNINLEMPPEEAKKKPKTAPAA